MTALTDNIDTVKIAPRVWRSHCTICGWAGSHWRTRHGAELEGHRHESYAHG